VCLFKRSNGETPKILIYQEIYLKKSIMPDKKPIEKLQDEIKELRITIDEMKEVILMLRDYIKNKEDAERRGWFY
jgi:predicted RNase H-like nuclease (RuvC/YqgF family)